MYKNIIILIIFFYTGLCHSQTLPQLYDSARATGNLELAEKVVKRALKEKNNYILADTYFLLGYYKKQDEKFYDAVLNYFEAIKLNRKLANYKKLANAIENAANIYSMSGFKSIALDYYHDVKNLKVQLADSLGLAITHFNIGKLYMEMEEYDSALMHYQQQLNLASRLTNKKQIALAYNAIGIIYRHKKDYHSAREYYSMALESNNLPEMQGHYYNNMGSLYLFEGDTAKAFENCLKVLILEDHVTTETAAKAFANLASIYENKVADSARYFYESSFEYLEKMPLTLNEDYLFTCTRLMNLYKSSDPDKAFDYGDKLADFAAEQIKLKQQLKTLNMRYQVEAATWKIENEKKADQLAIQNQILVYIVIGLLVCIMVLILLYRRNKNLHRDNKKKKKELDYFTINTTRLYNILKHP